MIFNIWDQVAITEMTRRAVDRVMGNTDRVANQFAPLTPIRTDRIGKGKVKMKALGKARGFLADDATPPTFRPQMGMVQEAWTLGRLSEMTPVEESLRRQLELEGNDSESAGIRDRAGATIIMRARALQIRQENLSDWLVMQAIINGELEVDVVNPPGGDTMTSRVIDYEYPTGHLAVVSTTFANLAAANPISVMRAYQAQLKRSAGEYGIHFWFSSEVWDYILNSDQVRNSINWNAPGNTPFIAPESLIKQLLYDPERVEFHITDQGWHEESAGFDVESDESKTRWIPKDRMVVTTSNPYRGEPIAQMYDGMVPVQTDWNDYEYRGPGSQSYVQLIPPNLTLMWRQEARRLPMIHHPECIISSKVVL